MTWFFIIFIGLANMAAQARRGNGSTPEGEFLPACIRLEEVLKSGMLGGAAFSFRNTWGLQENNVE